MPRMPDRTCPPGPVPQRQATIRGSELTGAKPVHRGNTAVYIQDTDVELKLKVLAESIAKDFLPLDFEDNKEITVITPSDLKDTAYIFVDNNGKPTKILAPSVLRTEIKWEDLAETTKQRIQMAIDAAKLTAGEHITIEHNVISADIGVETVNGKTGDVNITANDLNVYTKDDVYNKTEIQDALDSITVTVDGGRIE